MMPASDWSVCVAGLLKHDITVVTPPEIGIDLEIDRLRQKTNGSIGEEEVSPTRVLTAE